jgi:hypothetical protein
VRTAKVKVAKAPAEQVEDPKVKTQEVEDIKEKAEGQS